MANQALDPKIYDPENENEPKYENPDLGPGHNKPAGKSDGSRGHDVVSGNPSGPRGKDESAATKSDLKNSEESAADQPEEEGDKLNNGYTASKENTKRRSRGKLRISKRTAGIGGGIVALLGGGSLAFLFLLAPLKVESIVTDLQSHFFSSSENAVDNEAQTVFGNYIKRFVGPSLSLKGCGTTLSKNCTVNVFGNGNNPITNLYKTWSQAKLENKLAADYGIEFRYDSASKTYYMKAPGITEKNGEEAISKPGEGKIDDAMFAGVDRGTIRQTVNDALQNETFMTKILLRYQIGALLEQKYGIKRCIIFCGISDTIQDFSNAKVNVAQAFIAQRVITPRTQTLGIVLQCLLDSGCDPETTEPIPATPGSDELLHSEAENPEVEGAVRTNLTQLAASYGITDQADVDKMISDYKTIAENGYQKYALNTVLEKIGVTDLSDNVADSGTIIGWINTAANLITNIHKGGPSIRKLSYVTNAAAAVSLYMMYRTYADEIHTGHVSASEVGSFTSSLGPGNNGDPKDPEVGGTASAEDTPLYNDLINGNTPTASITTSLLQGVSPAKAYAATTASTSDASKNYLCSNGKPPNGQVCPEEVLGQGNSVADSLSAFTNLPGISIITGAAGAISGFTGAIGSIFSSVIGAIPGLSNIVSSIGNLVDQALKPVFSFITTQLIPDPFGTNMSGGRSFDMAAAGADVSGNDYAHTGLGGHELNNQQVAQVDAAQTNDAQEQFSRQPLFARMFSTSSQYSLISKVAVDMPFNVQSASSSFATLLSNPFSVLIHGFSSIFSSKASAATTAQNDPFNVTQYGYTQSDLDAIGDPEAYWDAHCSDGEDGATTQAWDLAASQPQNIDPNTGMPTNATTDPCLLIQEVAGASGGYFNSSNLTPDELADVPGTTSGGGTTTTPPGPSGYQSPFHDESNLTPSRVDEGVDYASTSPVPLYAIGNGVVTIVANGNSTFYAPYPNWISYKLTSGTASGDTIYVSEDCSPILVHEQEVVTSSTQLCSVNPGSIEMGWAEDGIQNPSANPVYVEGNATAYGQNFAELMDSLSVKTKPCYDYPGEALEGSLASGWPTWSPSPATTAGSNKC